MRVKYERMGFHTSVIERSQFEKGSEPSRKLLFPELTSSGSLSETEVFLQYSRLGLNVPADRSLAILTQKLIGWVCFNDVRKGLPGNPEVKAKS